MPLDSYTFCKDFAGPLVAALIGLCAVSEYIKGQRWKAKEFLAGQMKEFDASLSVQAVKRILDYGDTKIRVKLPGLTSLRDTEISIDQVISSLRILKEDAPLPPEVELSIRDAFDDFFTWTERFSTYSEANLVRTKDLEVYLSYYFACFLDPQGGGNFAETCARFLRQYKYSGTLKLFSQLGIELPSTK